MPQRPVRTVAAVSRHPRRFPDPISAVGELIRVLGDVDPFLTIDREGRWIDACTDVADDFARRYGNVEDLAWHDIADTVSMGDGGAAPEAWRWHDAGRTDITAERIISVHDEILAAAINRIS